MARKHFYTLSEAARVLELPQCRLLEKVEAGEIEGEQDPHSSRWMISKRAVDELISSGPSSADPSPEVSTEEFPGHSIEMIRTLVDELADVHRQVGHLRSRLDRARRTEKEEGERLLATLGQERERYRQERERADMLQEEANRLREELESERNKGPWRRLFTGQD